MDCYVDPALFQCAGVHICLTPFREPVQAVHRDGAAETAGPCKGNACSQELLHDAAPVPVGAGAGPVQAFENFVIDAYRQDVQRFPDFLSLRRRKCLQCAMWSRNGPREVFEEYVGNFAGKVI